MLVCVALNVSKPTMPLQASKMPICDLLRKEVDMTTIEDFSCPVCSVRIKAKDATVIDEGLIYHTSCYYPKGVNLEDNFVGAGVRIFSHDHLPAGSSD